MLFLFSLLSRWQVLECLIFPKRRESFFESVSSTTTIYFIDAFNILSTYFMDNIGTVRSVFRYTMLALKKAKLSSFAELNGCMSTCFRLLLRCQLSYPLEERGPFAYAK